MSRRPSSFAFSTPSSRGFFGDDSPAAMKKPGKAGKTFPGRVRDRTSELIELHLFCQRVCFGRLGGWHTPAGFSFRRQTRPHGWPAGRPPAGPGERESVWIGQLDRSWNVCGPIRRLDLHRRAPRRAHRGLAVEHLLDLIDAHQSDDCRPSPLPAYLFRRPNPVSSSKGCTGVALRPIPSSLPTEKPCVTRCYARLYLVPSVGLEPTTL
jgi:hypothetical protein